MEDKVTFMTNQFYKINSDEFANSEFRTTSQYVKARRVDPWNRQKELEYRSTKWIFGNVPHTDSDLILLDEFERCVNKNKNSAIVLAKAWLKRSKDALILNLHSENQSPDWVPSEEIDYINQCAQAISKSRNYKIKVDIEIDTNRIIQVLLQMKSAEVAVATREHFKRFGGFGNRHDAYQYYKRRREASSHRSVDESEIVVDMQPSQEEEEEG